MPVSDVDRAKQFYASLGWREDADFPIREDFRVVQLTPPGSPASIIFGTGVTAAAPGSATDLLAVADIEAARADLVARGVDVSDVFHGASGFDLAGTDARVSGPDPERTVLRLVGAVQRPRRQHLAAAGAHDPAPGALSHGRRRPSPSCSTRPPSTTTRTRRAPRRTTGGTGTPPT